MEIKDVVVLYVDGVPDANGEIMERSGMELPPLSVPVTHEFKREVSALVGTAHNFRVTEDNKVLVDFVLLEGLPAYEKLKGTSRYPCVGGRGTKHEGKVIKEFSISEISLCDNNVDPRITPIKVE